MVGPVYMFYPIMQAGWGPVGEALAALHHGHIAGSSQVGLVDGLNDMAG